MIVDLDLGDTRLILSRCMDEGLLRNQAAYVLATAYWETASTMRPVEEAFYLKDEVPDLDAWRRENLRYYPWHGRGYVQLTWEENYQKAAQATGVDLIRSPEQAMHPDVAAKVLVCGMSEGWFTGRKLSQYITLKASDFVNARRIVNGTDRAREIADIARAYDKALLGIGYGVEPIAEAPPPVSAPPIEKEPDMPGQGQYITRLLLLLLSGAGLGQFLSDAIPGIAWVTMNGVEGFFIDPSEILPLFVGGGSGAAWFLMKKYADRMGGKT